MFGKFFRHFFFQFELTRKGSLSIGYSNFWKLFPLSPTQMGQRRRRFRWPKRWSRVSCPELFSSWFSRGFLNSALKHFGKLRDLGSVHGAERSVGLFTLLTLLVGWSDLVNPSRDLRSVCSVHARYWMECNGIPDRCCSVGIGSATGGKPASETGRYTKLLREGWRKFN